MGKSMRFFASAAVLATVFLSACSSPPPLSPLGKNESVLAVGDSLTFGTGAPPRQSYPAVLQKIIGRKVINAGVPGETSGGALSRFSRLIKQNKPALIIVCTGGNDFLRRVDSSQTENNVRKIAQIAAAAKIPLVLVAVPRLSPFPINHSLYKTAAAEYNLWLEDDALKEVLFDGRLKSDHIHPNAAGYKKIAAAVAALLRRAGAVK